MIMICKYSKWKRNNYPTLTQHLLRVRQQLFSRCGIDMRPHRWVMDLSILEMLVMFRFNKDLRDER